MTTELVIEQVKQLPNSPGVYILRDRKGNILYVGKAANLHKRVRSYFSSPKKLTPKLQRMITRINDLDFFITSSEQEALILECNLIKRHKPYYNVRLKDDKTFPYLKINFNEDWPRVYITRQLKENGARYFGPFASAKSIRQTIKVLKGIFPFRSCSRDITGNDPRPCLDYYIHRCLGPCIGEVSKQEYDEVIKQVILFLEGKQEKVIQSLKSKMKEASENLDFEKAALLRDQIQALDKVIEGQKIATIIRGEQDVIAFISDKDRAYVQVFFIRSGKLIGRESFLLQGTSSEKPKQIMSSFIKQFYGSATYIPPLLLIQHPVEDKKIIENWLQNKRGSKVSIQTPYKGNKKQLVNIVAENAKQGLWQLKVKQQATSSTLKTALAEIERELHLSRSPSRMECYDISNIQGKAAAGSMVVFEKGKPKPSHYRRFRIKAVPEANDYAMLQEVLKRRLKRSGSYGKAASDTWSILPDLIIIDGGKGQLNAVLSVMHEAGVSNIPTAGLAKENEEIFVPQQKEAITLPKNSPGLQMLQRLRDEAHRFALGYHQKIRQKQTFNSALDDIPGIGTHRRQVLLKHFGSIQAIRNADIEELANIKGMNQNLAKKIRELL
ncbi:excinuclease ABC subunit UvrC [Chloroflexota bacterium]